MTREHFCALAERAGAYARQHPKRYRFKVALLAALGYAFIFGSILACTAVLVAGGLAFTEPWFWAIALRTGRLLILWVIFLLGLAVTLFSLVRSLFVPLPAPLGRRVQRAEAPELFALIDVLVAAGAAPRPHTVLLTWEFNAAVAQRPRLGWLGWSRDFLVLGVPLMGALSPLQFKAVLAHEFAHLRGGHGRFGNWIYRLRVIWAQLLERLVRRRQKLVALVVAFLKWYSPRFNGYTYALARAQEFEADTWAAQVTDKQVTAEALTAIWVYSRRLEEEFWQPLNLRANHESDVPRGVFTQLLSLLSEPAPEEAQRRWVRALLGRDTDPVHTHPCPAERLSALGLPVGAEDVAGYVRLPAFRGEPTAAQALLGERLAEYLSELESAWRIATGPLWQRRFARAQIVRKRREALEREEATGELPEAAAWELVCLRVEGAAGLEDARGWVAPFVARWPAHAAGQMALGRLLLESDAEAGIAHVEEAKRLEPRLATAAAELIAAYLRRCERGAEAAEHRRQANLHRDQLDASQAERGRFDARDHLLPHGLDEAAVADLRAQLVGRAGLRRVYLARKEVVHFPERPYYVVACVFGSRWALGPDRKLGGIMREIVSTLTVAGTRDYFLLVLSSGRRNDRRVRRMRKLAGAQVYPIPQPRRWWGWWRRTPAMAAAFVPVPLHRLGPAVPPALPAVQAGPMLSPSSGRRAPTAVAAALLIVAMPVGFVVYRAIAASANWRTLRQSWVDQMLLSSSTAKISEASRPIPINPKASTAEDDRLLFLHWASRTMLGGYTPAGRHNPRWDTAAQAFIDRALPWWCGCRFTPVSTAELLPQTNALLKLGCDDPVVLFLAGRVKAEADPQSAEAGNLFAKAVAGFQATPYLRGAACVAAAEFVADCERRRDGTGQAEPIKKLWLEWFEESLGDGSYGPEEQVALAHQVGKGEGADLFREYRSACCQALDKSSRGIAPWLKLWLSGQRHVDDAWDARGGDVASKVTAEGWRGFEAGLALARQDLTAAWQLEPKRPEAATAMLNVVMGENGSRGENERLWFDRAVTAQIDYRPVYQCMFYSLYPRWGGSRRAMLAFARVCARTGLFSTGVPMEFHQGLLNVGWDEEDAGSAFRDPELYTLLESVFAGYERDPAQQTRRVYFHGWHARAADLAGHDAEAYELLRQVDFQLPLELGAELNNGETGEAFIERVAALGGAGGAQTLAAYQASRDGQTERALALYREALGRVGSDWRAQNYLQGKVGVLTADQRLRKGDWLSFQPGAGQGGTPVGWQSKLGRWRVEADGSLTGHCGASGLMLVSGMHVGPNFEVRGEMDFLPGAATEVQSGVVFGHPDFESEDWRSLRLRRNNREAAVALLSQHWHDGPKQAIPVLDHNTFVLQSWRGLLTVMVNGKVVFRDQSLPEGSVQTDDALVGLGGYSHQGNVFDVRYRNLQIRRLNATPVALVDRPTPAGKNQPGQIARR